ncbi:MAG: lipid-A-disaccharide synthase [Gammaproteobacteria bacterium]|jgi:lipid-A-disaccharide synthase|nr:lipid-A-disaccharide synthase [Gammaproteobacteria bacterium]MDP6146806.1 lipid-A-disaccharide synthase [Gammaproteobacteria bacterium]HJM09178.1 lipid-A-disaccharide synthase [Gammaproteobacteria bacterium]HJN01329.1 lipid-A-disaccharide synthase [Gammaproteobacteria bacterium]|tara:strand:- start:8958 stop:10085 length:1128 start_codon:yes stop_codon:yes gene_type:complete
MAHFVVVAGEPSGDVLGARLISDLKKANPNHQFSGIAGPRMIAEGCEPWFDISDLSVMGLIEVIKHLPRILRIRKAVIEKVKLLEPDAYIGIDYPEFNLSIERALKKRQIKTIHMVCPSFWAWREARANKFKSAVDLMLCLFPFEPKLLKEKNVEAAFIGHPLADEIGIDHCNLSLSNNEVLNIALLPGSRRKEIEYHLEIMLDAALIIQERLSSISKDCIFSIPTRFKEMEHWINSYAKYENLNINIYEDTSKCLSTSDLIITKSGTSTLESALYKKKTIVIYKMSPVSFFLLKRLNLINVSYASLPNILLGYEFFKEFIQNDFKAEDISHEAIKLLKIDSDDYFDPLIQLHKDLQTPKEESAAFVITRFLGMS